MELAACQQHAPKARILLLKKTRLKLAGEGFEAAVCFEGPARPSRPASFSKRSTPRLNQAEWRPLRTCWFKAQPASTSLAEYETLLTQSGFGDIQLWDVTSTCWKPFQAYNKQIFWTKLLAGEITQKLYDEIMSRLPGQNQPVNLYVIGRARKIDQPKKLRLWINR